MTSFELPHLAPPPAPPPSHREVRAQLPGLLPGPAASRPARARAQREAAFEAVRAFHRQGGAGLSTARLLAAAADALVEGLWAELEAETPLTGSALVALGGYGRRELSPGSDLDLLLVHHRRRSAGVAERARLLSTLLWDARVTVGWSVRTPEETLAAAAEDATLRTALLDARVLVSQRTLGERFVREVLLPQRTRKAEAFIAAKVAELRERREKFGDSVFLLEPQLKSGEGGLRDLETALWVAQVRFGVRGLGGLLEAAILPASEVARLRAARDFLLRTRHEVHFLRGRKEDRLTFDLQESVARFFRYGQGDGLPVEQFMRDYYLSAGILRRAADALIARAEEQHAPSRGPFRAERRVGPFKVFRGRLTVDGDAELFLREPASAVRLFHAADELGVPVYSWALDHVVQAAPALAEARGSEAVVEALRALLIRPGTRGEALEAMHALGLLGVLVPEFGRVTARHQFDLYHAYTVDVHTLRALRRLYALRAGDFVETEPERTRAIRDLADVLPLVLGMLLHDAGKGMGGDHSERGRELMVALGARLGLSARQQEVAEFLVLHHLTLSHLAQRRDLSDPQLLADFGRLCGDSEKLTCLDLLTWADISSVAPGMWTEWRARLVHELTTKTQALLAGQGWHGEREAREAFRQLWTRRFGAEEAERLLAASADRYLGSTPPGSAVLHGLLLRRARRTGFAAALRRVPEPHHAELHLAAKDRPGLLALWSGVLAAHGIDILSARIASTTDGAALDVFEVRSAARRPLERARWRRARSDLRAVLEGKLDVGALLERRRRAAALSRRLPGVATRVSVDNGASRDFTVVDVRAEDRLGLLHEVATCFADAGLEIALAKVATEANRAIDSFYVAQRGGKVESPAALEALRERLEAVLAPPAPPLTQPVESRGAE
ncbi:MAG: [protein-PII] uridylyltransferase [Myxococcaceae bacterium]